jgi:hypothetical protein
MDKRMEMDLFQKEMESQLRGVGADLVGFGDISDQRITHQK